MKIAIIATALLVLTGCGTTAKTGLFAAQWAGCNDSYPYIPTGKRDQCGLLYHQLVEEGLVTPPPKYQELRDQHATEK